MSGGVVTMAVFKTAGYYYEAMEIAVVYSLLSRHVFKQCRSHVPYLCIHGLFVFKIFQTFRKICRVVAK